MQHEVQAAVKTGTAATVTAADNQGEVEAPRAHPGSLGDRTQSAVARPANYL